MLSLEALDKPSGRIGEVAASTTRRGMGGERCPRCNGVRGRVIAKIRVVKKYNDGLKVHAYEYWRFTHRKPLKDGTLKRIYCYLAVDGSGDLP